MSFSVRTAVAWGALLACLVPSLQAQGAAARRQASALVPFDNQVGRYLNFEVGQVQPMALSADGTKLYVVNTQGWRLAALETGSQQILWEAPMGIGACSVVAPAQPGRALGGPNAPPPPLPHGTQTTTGCRTPRADPGRLMC